MRDLELLESNTEYTEISRSVLPTLESEFGERSFREFREQGSNRRCHMHENESRSECMATDDT